MNTVGSNVVSLLGFPITNIPEFPDKRGQSITFQACMRDGGVIEVRGTRTIFGLVLHRSLNSGGWERWAVSEPHTGKSMACGHTRQGALDDIALRVAYYGGEAAFKQLADYAVSRHHSKRRMMSAKPPGKET